MRHNPYRSLIDHLTWHIMYGKGWRKPNHPVPAIPLEVWYGDYYCMIINADTKDLVNSYEYERNYETDWSVY